MSSLLKSYKNSQFGLTLSNTIFFKRHHALVTKLLETASVLVVAAEDNPDLIHSYIIYEYLEDVPVVHYVFCKYSYRHLGFTKRLLNQVITDPTSIVLYTHRTKGGDNLVAHYSKAIYDPYYLFSKE